MKNVWSVTTRREATLPAPAVVALFAYGALASLLEPHAMPITVATSVPIAIVVAIAISRGWHHRRLEDPGRPERAVVASSVALWVVMIATTAGLAYVHYQSQPRDVYPTLSSLASSAFSVPGVRAVAFGFWLWLGWYLLDR